MFTNGELVILLLAHGGLVYGIAKTISVKKALSRPPEVTFPPGIKPPPGFKPGYKPRLIVDPIDPDSFDWTWVEKYNKEPNDPLIRAKKEKRRIVNLLILPTICLAIILFVLLYHWLIE